MDSKLAIKALSLQKRGTIVLRQLPVLSEYLPLMKT